MATKRAVRDDARSNWRDLGVPTPHGPGVVDPPQRPLSEAIAQRGGGATSQLVLPDSQASKPPGKEHLHRRDLNQYRVAAFVLWLSSSTMVPSVVGEHHSTDCQRATGVLSGPLEKLAFYNAH